MSQTTPPNPAPPTSTSAPQDAPRKAIIYYAVGNMENALANHFFTILSIVTVVALRMEPILVGLIIAIKTLIEAVADPLMAQITDNARTRWSRCIPFILFGGTSRVLLVFVMFLLFPRSDTIKTNQDYAREQATTEAASQNAQSASVTLEGATSETARQPQPADLPKPKPPPPSLFENIQRGVYAVVHSENAYHKQVFYYMLGFSIVFSLLSTVNSVPYYALGIEIAPSYDGRTRTVTYRAFADKIMLLGAQWVLPFCFLPMFDTVFDGLVWYGVAVCLVGIPTTVAMCKVVKEPAYATEPKTAAKKTPILKSIWQTGRNVHFLKIAALYALLGFSNGIFAQVSTFLILYWVFEGNMLLGTVVNGYAATIALVLGFSTLPLIQWACRRFSKHAALRAAIIWMALGAVMKWFLINPGYPYLQLLLPFFFSIGIGAVFTILPALMADVTDVDELNNSVRREGMFGAVMSFINKSLASVQPVLAAAVLTASGFDASAGVHQDPEVIHNMRLLASWIPAIFMILALLLLIRYPLTRARMDEIKATIENRRAQT